MTYESMAGLIELGFFYSVVLGLGARQLLKIRREIARDRDAARAADTTSSKNYDYKNVNKD